MHSARSDLELDLLPSTVGDGCVDRAVSVGFGAADVVLEAVGHSRPAAVNCAENNVYVVFAVVAARDYAHAIYVEYRRVVLYAALHFAPDREWALLTAFDQRVADSLLTDQEFDLLTGPLNDRPGSAVSGTPELRSF